MKVARLKELFECNTEYGLLYAIKPLSISTDTYQNLVVGYVDSLSGDVIITIDNQPYKLKDVIWAMHHNIDLDASFNLSHKDGDRLNCRLNNLTKSVSKNDNLANNNNLANNDNLANNNNNLTNNNNNLANNNLVGKNDKSISDKSFTELFLLIALLILIIGILYKRWFL